MVPTSEIILRKIKTRVLAPAFIFFLMQAASGQLTFKFEKSINTNYVSEQFEHVISFNDGNFYFIPLKNAAHSFTIASFNIRDEKDRARYRFTLPSEAIIEDFVVADTFLLVLTGDHLYHFIRDKNEFLLKDSLSVKEFQFTQILYSGKNKILLYKAYNHHPASCNIRHALGIYNLRKNMLEKTLSLDTAGIGYSHLSNNQWAAADSSRIFIASPLAYIIKIYNGDFELQDSLSRNINGWAPIKDLPFESSMTKIHPKDLIRKLHDLDTSIYRMEKIFLVNDSLLMTSYIPKNGFYRKRIYDVWNLKTKKLLVNGQVVDYTAPGIEYSACNFPVNFSYSVPMYFWKNRLIAFLPYEHFPTMPLSQAQYQQAMEKYYLKNKAYYSIAVFTPEIK